ncbi:MAG: YhgN family NAAT transporter [Cardiobacteriaceae bacterium]|nr:YhgN family NAAT transporter [Cardiobacteriaceae bacterium]
MDTLAVAVTLFLIMDPLGNIPIFLSVLKQVEAKRRSRIIVREMLIALAVMLLFLFSGPTILRTLSLSREAVAIGGALVLMIIAIRMIFPLRGAAVMGDDDIDGEPFIVPLAIPLVAGPSLLATLILLVENDPGHSMRWFTALMMAWSVTLVILLSSQILFKLLGNRGLKAIERLMGMILISVAVQMMLDAIKSIIT